MQHQPEVNPPNTLAPRRIAFVQAIWHRDIVDQCRDAFIAEIVNLGYAESDIDFFEVAGVFEIPLHAKLLANSGQYAAIVAAGLVVDGGIYAGEEHHSFFLAHFKIKGAEAAQACVSTIQALDKVKNLPG